MAFHRWRQDVFIGHPARQSRLPCQSLPSRKAQVHTEHLGKAEGEEQYRQQRQHEDGNDLATRAQQRAPVRSLVPLVVMPFDGKEHARAEDEHLERDEDYRDPIDHFLRNSALELLLSTVMNTTAAWQAKAIKKQPAAMHRLQPSTPLRF